ncbi:MAG: hypothetical protein AAGF87_07070, partial [Bacteroidota bacterium]
MRYYLATAALFVLSSVALRADEIIPEFLSNPTPADEIEEELPPLPCDAFYAVTSGIFGGGTFGRYEPNGTITTIATIPDGLNGAGYNSQDGFVYAYSGNTLYRFHDDGTV